MDLYIDSLLGFLQGGLLALPGWGLLLYCLLSTHFTIICVTLFLHRCQAHKALTLHPSISHIFRFWLWLASGMVTKEWVAVHRKHHAKCETKLDPHSPKYKGIKTLLFSGVELYKAEANHRDTLQRYGNGTPDDWIERKLYTPHPNLGVALLLIVNICLFGILGLSIWAIQMIWIPFFAAGVINGIGHWWGYRNFDIKDWSHNIVPWGILIGGEELHNNHHTYPTSAKLSKRAFEFDVGWFYIQILKCLRLVTAIKSSPVPKFKQISAIPSEPSVSTLEHVITHRYVLMSYYARLIKQLHRHEIKRIKAQQSDAQALQKLSLAKPWIHRERTHLSQSRQAKVFEAVLLSPKLRTVLNLREEFKQIWEESTATHAQLMTQLRLWCQNAEASGIEQMRQFSYKIKQLA